MLPRKDRSLEWVDTAVAVHGHIQYRERCVAVTAFSLGVLYVLLVVTYISYLFIICLSFKP